MTMLQPRVGLTLDPTVWPRTADRVGGVLAIGGVDVRDLALEYGTPAYVLDEDDFRERCRQWRVAFRAGAADGDVYYAGKAFLCVAVARWVAAEGLSLDVCTGGELAVAERAGFPADRILFHGNNKSVEELRRAVTTGVGRVVLDSFEELARLAFIAEAAGVRQRVLIRVTPGVEAHTHSYVATGQEDQKFGFSLAAGAAAEAVRRVLALPSLELVGLHCHIGSQIFDTSGFRLAAHRMVGLLAEVRAEHGGVVRVVQRGADVVAHPAVDTDVGAQAGQLLDRADLIQRDRRRTTDRSTGFDPEPRYGEPGRRTLGGDDRAQPVGNLLDRQRRVLGGVGDAETAAEVELRQLDAVLGAHLRQQADHPMRRQPKPRGVEDLRADVAVQAH